jgi:maltose alpha-D-glucosyltransferase/alpha-amylase
MAENLEVEGRLAVRTPMQWKDQPNGGFSLAAAEQLVRPLPKGKYSPDKLNAAAQMRDAGSLLNWMERLIRRRKECGEFGFGQIKVIDPHNEAVFAHYCDWEGRVVLALHNLDGRECEVSIEEAFSEEVESIVDIWADQQYPPVKDRKARLGAYGYRWLRMLKKGQELLL